MLVVLQGMDTSGKDGTIKKVMRQRRPAGLPRRPPSRSPTPLELAHDFLWRVHSAAPAKGMLGIFNRSHYEDVLIVRVHNLVPEDGLAAALRPDQRTSSACSPDSDTIVLKFFLHISKEEQEERLLERERERRQALEAERRRLHRARSVGRVQAAYEDVLRRCATPEAPWYIVPADRKWFRNLAFAEALVEALRPYRDAWLAALRERGERELAAIKAARQARSKPGVRRDA